MKFLVATLLTALVGFIGGLYLPWWEIALVAFGVAIAIHQKPARAFFSGFAGIFILWAVLSIWINMKNQGILAKKIASLLPLGGNTIVIILFTAFLGGLVGGFAAMSGSYMRSSKT